MTQSLFQPALAGVALCVVSACASTSTPPPAATLSFASASACSETLNAASAQLVSIRKNQESGNLTTLVDTASACQVVDGTDRPYALYRLPGSVEISTVQAGGVMQLNRLFAAEVITLDDALAPVRTFAPEAFRHRGGSWSVLFQPRSTERYVVVRANDDLIGSVYHFTSTGAADPGATENRVAPDKLRVAYSYEGLAFTRVFLKEPAPVGPKDQ